MKFARKPVCGINSTVPPPPVQTISVELSRWEAASFGVSLHLPHVRCHPQPRAASTARPTVEGRTARLMMARENWIGELLIASILL